MSKAREYEKLLAAEALQASRDCGLGRSNPEAIVRGGPPRQSGCNMSTRLRTALWVAWATFFTLGLVCLGVFMQGVLRDTHAGDPVIRVDFTSRPTSASVPFRVWGSATYALMLSSVNHDPQHVGTSLEGEFEVLILGPNENAVFRQRYAAGTTGHSVPSNYGDKTLTTIQLNDWPLRSWKLQVKLDRPDPKFRTVLTEVKLRKQRYDPGMGGLMNYAMMLPAAVFLALALGTSLALVKRSKVPVALTCVMLVAFAAALL